MDISDILDILALPTATTPGGGRDETGGRGGRG
eukprot:CAMPEP_0173298302 /NCGR_PEP_ID=MMETSP1143-20121109/16023_1 /TAXON_ID=483371 /ORGANISM="non described non described, Strain CCMP2298" /LENGTH=32 /DNA_ID= /DNA_START= /DNA_END= /DNA_ORIENTATION=